jgi:hypothetical protein
VTDEAYIRVAASDGSLRDIPARNISLALERDPLARTLPPADRDVLALTPEDEAWLWEMGVLP